MKISAIKSNNINFHKKSFMGQTVENKPLSSGPSEKFKRERKNVFKFLIPILISAIGLTIAYFIYKARNPKEIVEEVVKVANEGV